MMEIMVPRLKQVPIAAMIGLVVMTPIRAPAAARILPEVKMVGKDWFRVTMIASLGGMDCFRSL